jgi:exosortase A
MKHTPIAIALLLFPLLCPFVIYTSTARSLVDIWNSSETFAHGYIILPISLWLIWRRRQLLAITPMVPCNSALLLLVLAGIGWLLSDLGDVQVLRQYSFVALFPLIVLTLGGRRLFQAIAFPLCFLLLAVPFGDMFIAPLINFTADFTVTALQLTGIPVLRNGSSFTIPTGNWSVVDACSGVRYLISSFTLGCLFAYLTYTGWKKRLLLIIASLIVPVIANGLRAYLIVMLGHLSSMTLAVGVDHLIYGWVFFGLVMYLLFSVGNHWRDDPALTPAWPTQTQTQPESSPHTALAATLGSTGAVLLCLAIFPFIGTLIERSNYNPATPALGAFHSGWERTASFVDWQPHYLPAQAELNQAYTRDGHRINLIIKYYRNQTHAAQLISSSNKMNVDESKSWVNNTQSDLVENLSRSGTTVPLAIHETQISSDTGHLLIWSMDWINGQFNNSHIAGKMIQTFNKLRLAGDDAAAVIICAPFSDNPEEARAAMRSFLSTDFDAIDIVLNANRKR